MLSIEIIWVAAILLGITVLGWYVFDWLERTQVKWSPNEEPRLVAGQGELAESATLDLDTELMQGYPLDSFSPALLWRLPPDASTQLATVDAATNAVPVTDEDVDEVPPTPVRYPSDAR